MNVWPDDLWWSERIHTRNTLARYANAAEEETGPSPSTTESTDPLAEPGAHRTSSSSAATAPLDVTDGWNTIPMTLKRKGIGFDQMGRHTSLPS